MIDELMEEKVIAEMLLIPSVWRRSVATALSVLGAARGSARPARVLEQLASRGAPRHLHSTLC